MMDILQISNIDLLTVGAAASAIGLIGFLVFLSNVRSATARSFFFFSIMTILWNFSNFFQYQFQTETATLIALRLDLFIATWHAFSFFHFSYTFPLHRRTYPRWYVFFLLPAVAIVSLLSLSDLVFSGIKKLAPVGEITQVTQGPLILLFVLCTVGLLIGGIGVLARHLNNNNDLEEKRRMRLVLVGMIATAGLILFFSMLMPLFFSRFDFLPYSAAFFLPFLALIFYSIYQYGLFNFKVLSVHIFTYIWGLLIFVEIIFTHDIALILFRIALLVGIVLIGIMLTRSVVREVEQRELIQKQEQELEHANKQQEGLLHFISHEIKGYLTKNEAAFAAIADGDFGVVTPELKTMVVAGLADVRKGVRTIMDILDAANLKKGTVTFKKDPLDLKTVILAAIEEARPSINAKHLEFDVNIPDGNYTLIGDEEKLREHVIRNLIDNSIRYTPTGKITVQLQRIDTRIIFSIQDTGIGITPEDMKNLFTEGGHGKDSIKINVHSTGYGLFIAKEIVEGNGGTIRAESEGAGKGSRFVVELPAK